MGRMTKVLVIDDEPGFTQLLKIRLEAVGPYQVVMENDSLKALEVARACCPDIILLDVVMPGLDGGQVEELLRADPDLKDVPLFLLTALVLNEDPPPEFEEESGRAAVIAKPVSTEKLVAAIEQRLAEKS